MGSHGPPYDGQATQAPRMMHHERALYSLQMPSTELLTNKITAQAAEIDTLLRENRKLATTNVTMRKEVRANLEELQLIKSHIASIHTESDIQIRGLVDKLREIDGDVSASDMLKEELTRARNEANTLMKIKQELTLEHQISEESIKAAVDGKNLPKLLAELEELKQEHQNLRVIFEREKGSNKELAEQLHILEKNLISLAREVEKLRADVMNAKMEKITAKPSVGNYGSPTPLYQPTGGLFGNSNAETVHDNPAPYTRPYRYATSSQPVVDFLGPQV